MLSQSRLLVFCLERSLQSTGPPSAVRCHCRIREMDDPSTIQSVTPGDMKSTTCGDRWVQWTALSHTPC
ncbi:hypothetical protein GDO81_017092 [Engystomops pustulosus]|uniref:Uncharacterized protein n=1 Tax=Engystomops pustulosus TaxID=76066 RepID=A0AAV7AKN0_ENGPU|nr:hypothetical protein GDO81_017092 [Engystomops pustulosus]